MQWGTRLSALRFATNTINEEFSVMAEEWMGGKAPRGAASPAVRAPRSPRRVGAAAPAEGVAALRAQAVEPTTEAIRERAYQIYLTRGDRPGDPLSDWLQAERELAHLARAARTS
jgi:hypothetical protein